MRTFRNRLLVLLIGLVVAAQTVTLLAVLVRTSATVQSRAAEQLTAGAMVARRLLNYRAAQLSNAVGVLAADFGLREAIANGDPATIQSAAQNHSRRIGADMLLVLDDNGVAIVASGGARQFSGKAVRPLTNEIATVTYLSTGGGIYQVLAAPVRAPNVIGYVAIGFAVDRQLVAELADLLTVDVALVATDSNGVSTLVASSRPAASRPLSTDELGSIARARMPTRIGSGGGEILAISDQLSAGAQAVTLALLRPVEDVYASYVELRNTLLIIMTLAVAIAVAFAFWLGRATTAPITQLVEGARRIERGEYRGQVVVAGGEEFEQLAASFNAMQSGIADREARLVHQAMHDEVTGLPNRRHFETVLLGSIRQRDPGRLQFVAIIEVANLRQFSGSLGFEFADRVLSEIGRRLTQAAGDGRTVARLEGARFAYIGSDSKRDRITTHIANTCAALAAQLLVGNVNVRAEVLAGVALPPEHGDTPEEILRRAEIALDDARNRQSRVSIFQFDLDAVQQRRLRLSADLPEAIGSGQMHLAYQPKVTIAEHRIRSAEALVRWTHNTLGDVSPGEFVPLAENTGSYGLLTRWVLRKSLQQLAAWRRDGFMIDLAVNLSAADISDKDLPGYVLEQLRSNGLPATALLLEITESAVMRDVATAARHMEQLRYAGVRFAIDDFGTGYSSLSQLKRLPVDELKIDRSFVRDATVDDDDAVIVRSTIELGHSMGLRVVAEGVETETQWRLLQSMGCDDAQGFLIAQPLSAAQFIEYLQTNGRQVEDAGSQTAVLRALRTKN